MIVEVWAKVGLVTYYLLFVMELKTRCVHFAGCTHHSDEAWMTQIARNLTAAEDGFLNGKSYLLTNRDGAFRPAFRALLTTAGVEPVRLPPRSPNLNAWIEQFHRSIKEEYLEKMLFFNEDALRTATREYLLHDQGERNHQGLDNNILIASAEVGRSQGEVQCGDRLGGLLRYYHRAAA